MKPKNKIESCAPKITNIQEVETQTSETNLSRKWQLDLKFKKCFKE